MNTYRGQFPAAVGCFADDRDALLAIHRVPVRHRIRVRTTNLAERSFEEERQGTKVMPRLMSEKATMKLVFATMIRAAERWCRVSINDVERHQLKLLRAQLGLDPPPAEDQASRRRLGRGTTSSTTMTHWCSSRPTSTATTKRILECPWQTTNLRLVSLPSCLPLPVISWRFLR